MKSHSLLRQFQLLVMFSMALGLSASCSGGQDVHVGRNVPAAQRVSMDNIDHSAFNTLLNRYVDEQGNVDYARWHGSNQDTQALDDYLAALSTASPQAQASRPAVLAFWINAYNAVTIRGILREYPTTSIRNHTARAIGYNIWKDLLLNVGGQDFSLEQIEHEVLRKMNEPRIHFAIVCASRSCPRLRNEAYTAGELEEQLADNTQAFFADSRNFQYDANRQQLHLSAILDWFAEDFGANQAEQLRTIAPYLPTAEAQQAAVNNSAAVSHLEYDWGLNEQAVESR